MNQPAFMAYRNIWKIIDWVFPPVCVGCGITGELLCNECKKTIHYLDHGLCPVCGYPRFTSKICKGCGHHVAHYSMIRSVAEYAGCIKNAIHQLKYQNNLGLGQLFAPMMADLVIQNRWQIDVILPVPLSKSRYSNRGYNQAGILAYPIALLLNVKYDDKVIIRKKETSTQVELNAHERQINIQDAFLVPGKQLAGKNILLVDDVITTGATINDCARAIKSSGAKEVYGISVGRVIVNDNIHT